MTRSNSSNVDEIQFDDPKIIQAQTFAYWSKRYRKEVLQMSLESFGNYLASFIKYLLLEYGDVLTEKDRKNCEERLDGELTEMVRGFEVEERYSEMSMNQAWRKYFMYFCITGKLESDFDLFSYLNTGDSSLLPINAWERKEIPLHKAFIKGDNDLIKRIETLERQVAALQKDSKATRISKTTLDEYTNKLIN